MNEEIVTQEATDTTEDAQLAAGFNDAPIVDVPQEVAETQEEVATEAVEETPEPKIETVNLTADQWRSVQDKLAEIETFRGETSKKIDAAHGRYGELNRTLQQMQQRTSTGVKFDAAKFKRLGADFPEIAAMLAEDLSESFQGSVQAAPVFNPEEIEQKVSGRVAEEVQKIAVKAEMRELARRHADWKEVINTKEFVEWGKTLPPQELAELGASVDADYISPRLDQFKAYREKVTAVAQKKQSGAKRLEAAITPQGSASSPHALTERDLFKAGFSTG